MSDQERNGPKQTHGKPVTVWSYNDVLVIASSPGCAKKGVATFPNPGAMAIRDQSHGEIPR